MRLEGYVGPALLHVRVVKTGLYRAENHVSVESVQEQLEAVKLDVELLKQKCDSEPKTTKSFNVKRNTAVDRLEKIIEKLSAEVDELRPALKDALDATHTTPEGKIAIDTYDVLVEYTISKTWFSQSLRAACVQLRPRRAQGRRGLCTPGPTAKKKHS